MEQASLLIYSPGSILILGLIILPVNRLISESAVLLTEKLSVPLKGF